MSETGFNIEDIDKESGEPTGGNATINIGGREMELHLPELEDVGHPQVPDTDQDYIAREINGRTDLEVLSFAINDEDFFAMLEGEAATGKNFSIDTVCGVANWPRIRVNFGISTTYESLVGKYVPAESDEDDIINRAEAIERTARRITRVGSFSEHTENDDISLEEARLIAEAALPNESGFTREDGLLTIAVKNGLMFVADEINAAEPEALMPFNGLTEQQGDRYLTIEEESEIIEPHPRFRLVGTRNPVTYAGTTDMNSALESRAYIIEYDYHEDAALKEILTSRTNIIENESEPAVENLVRLVQNVRQMEQSGTDIVTKISTRDLIKIGRLTDIMSLRNATKTVMLGVADPTDKTAIREEINGTRFPS